MKTPIEVGRYRFKIIKNMLAGALTIDQAKGEQNGSRKQ